MTDWSREYWHRLFVNRRAFGNECIIAGHDVEVHAIYKQSGPYTVWIIHEGTTSGRVTEDDYREDTSLDELFAEWLDHEHKMACICDDGGVVWCPQHGDLWYDFEGNQYRVERDGRPKPPEKSISCWILACLGIFV